MGTLIPTLNPSPNPNPPRLYKHHILPKANGGTNAKFNLTCTNIITNEEAGNKTTFVIDDTIYQVRKNYGKAGHHICEIDG